MVASTSVPLNKKSQEAFIEYYRSLQSLQNVTRLDTRSRLERIDREYQRELNLQDEQARAKQANRSGDPSRYQDITIPVVMPQVETAVAHQTSVFLTGDPLFAVVSSPDFIDEALQMQSVIEENSIRGGWPRELILFFRDGFKYNFAPIEISWDTEVTYSVETNLDKSIEQGIPKEVIWSGNKLKRLDPYNTFVDTRVPPTDVYKKGEFAGYTEPMTRIELKAFISRLPDKIIANIVPAFESGIGTFSSATNAGAMNFYVPQINPDTNEENYKRGGTNWLRWAGLSQIKSDIDYKDAYEVTTLYAKVLPSEFDLRVPNRNTPQIYKLIIVNHEHIIYAEQQTNAHSYLPIIIGQPLEDGLGYQTNSLADNSSPFQAVTTAYMASILASRRRAISDRVLYDPSRIDSAHINSSNPSAKIPVRPAAYGKNLGESVFQFPYKEDQAAISIQQISMLLGLSNTLAGQNQAAQGQFVKGNKTLHEFESVMQNAFSRDQLASILLEFQCFVPMKLIIKLNILQFQGGTTIYNRDQEKLVEIDPVALRKAVIEFRIADGLVPSDKIISADSFATALQVMGSSPEIAAAYNMGQAFSYLMKTQGAEISAFEKSPEQVAYEQAVNQWQQVALAVIDKGGDIKSIPPAPLPAAFGYNPATNKPAPADNSSSSTANTPVGSPTTPAEGP